MPSAESTMSRHDGVRTLDATNDPRETTAPRLQVAVNADVTLTVKRVRLHKREPIADIIIDTGTVHDAATIHLASPARLADWASFHASDVATSDELLDAFIGLLDDALASLSTQARTSPQPNHSVEAVMRPTRPFVGRPGRLDNCPPRPEPVTGARCHQRHSLCISGHHRHARCRGRAVGVDGLFHTPDHEAYTTISIDGHSETLALSSRAFKRYVSHRYYDLHQTMPRAQVLSDAMGVLEGTALFDGFEEPVHTRVAERDGAIYLDLGNATWQVVKIDTCGWSEEPTPAVKFRRPRGMRPLPTPVSGGSIDMVHQYLNIVSDADWALLLLGWLVQALRPRGPYPALILSGEQGSAKSTTARALRSLIDPNSAPLRAEPRDARDLAIAARNGWVMSFDNLSSVSPWLSDALCRLSTGGASRPANSVQTTVRSCSTVSDPVILTGIEELATRGDLLDRAIVLHLPAIPVGKRQAEASFWAAFEREAPAMLGALLTAVSTAIARLPETHLERLPRMADFALWATAAEPGLGLETGAFIDAYTGNRADANDLALEASPVAAAVLTLIESIGRWEGQPLLTCSAASTLRSATG